MPSDSKSTEHQIRTVTIDGQGYLVTLRVGFDGVEHIGRLWFTDAATKDAYQDHGAIPGFDAADAVRKAKEFNDREMEQRCYRALSEKRRFGKLRSATDEMIDKIKELNRVVVGLEKGMIEQDRGKVELAQIQRELLAIAKTLRDHAGVEDDPEPGPA